MKEELLKLSVEELRQMLISSIKDKKNEVPVMKKKSKTFELAKS